MVTCADVCVVYVFSDSMYVHVTHCSIMVLIEILLTHLLHVCDNVANFQTELIILLLLIFIQNDSF